MTKPEETGADSPTQKIEAPLEDLTDAIGAAFAAVSPESDTISNPSQEFTPTKSTSSVGRQIGPYKLLRQIGEGGMGTVSLAEQERPVRRQVALKLIKAGVADDQMIARFEAERQALSMMDHPHIAKVLDVGSSEDGSPYFVMELVQGDPITQYCDTNKLTLNERLELFIQACDAVQHAHHKGIIHRDLKPSNMLVHVHNDKHTVKVIDFGLAKALEQAKLTDKTVLTEFGRVMGTVQYMSPEQAQLDSIDIDTRTDVYSLGVILYELLTGSTPIDKVTLNNNALLQVLEMVREQSPPLPSNRLSSSIDKLDSISSMRKIQSGKLQQILKGELDWVVMRALEKDRARRYATPNDLAADVRRYLDGDAVVARPPSVSYRLRKFVRKNWVPVGIVGGLFAIISTSALLIASALANANVARGEAEASANRSDKILQIVRDSFHSVDPSSGAIAEMSAKDVLLKAEGYLEESDLDNLGKIQLLSQLCSSFLGLGEYEQAIRAAEGALAASVEQFGEDHENTWNSRHELANALRADRQLKEAIKIDREVLEQRRERLGPHHRDTLASMHNLAIGLHKSGSLSEALTLNEQVYELAKVHLGPEHSLTLSSMDNLARGYGTAERHSDAIQLAAELLKIRRAKLGPDHPDILSATSSLVQRYHALGRRTQANELCEEVLRVSKVKFGRDHQRTLSTMDVLADGYRRVGRTDEALGVCEEALELAKAELGPDDAVTLNLTFTLANIYRDLGRIPEALEIDLKVLKLRQSQLGPNHPDTWNVFNQIVWHCAMVEEENERLTPELMESFRTACESTHYFLMLSTLAVAEFRIGNNAEAIAAAEKSIKMTPSENPDYPVNLAVLAMSHHKLGQEADADRFREQFDKGMRHPGFKRDTTCQSFADEVATVLGAKKDSK